SISGSRALISSTSGWARLSSRSASLPPKMFSHLSIAGYLSYCALRIAYCVPLTQYAMRKILAEERADRAAAVDALDRGGQERGHAQDADLGEPLVLLDRYRISRDQLGDRALAQPVDGGAGEHGVDAAGDDVDRATLEDGAGGVHDRAAGVDLLVDDDSGAAG